MRQKRVTGNTGQWEITRRDFLGISGAALISGLMGPSRAVAAGEAAAEVVLRFGMVTDAHYADIEPGGYGGSRFYRESLAKLGECVERMNQEKVSFLCELGDFKDQATPPEEKSTLGFLTAVNDTFSRFQGPRHYVLGNHDLDSISKEQFRSITGARAGYYSFDEGGSHFVVLDACYDADGGDYDHGRFDWMDTNIAGSELEWLEKDLAGAEGRVVAFVHQRLDGEGAAFVNNAPEVREVFEKSGKVHAVFQGHDHAGAYTQMGGTHYYTLKGLVEGPGEENNSYATVDVHADGGLTVTGYRKAVSKGMGDR